MPFFIAVLVPFVIAFVSPSVAQGIIPCMAAMRIADVNMDRKLDKTEYVSFLNLLSDNSFVRFVELPQLLQNNYLQYATRVENHDMDIALTNVAPIAWEAVVEEFCCHSTRKMVKSFPTTRHRQLEFHAMEVDTNNGKESNGDDNPCRFTNGLSINIPRPLRNYQSSVVSSVAEKPSEGLKPSYSRRPGVKPSWLPSHPPTGNVSPNHRPRSRGVPNGTAPKGISVPCPALTPSVSPSLGAHNIERALSLPTSTRSSPLSLSQRSRRRLYTYPPVMIAQSYSPTLYTHTNPTLIPSFHPSLSVIPSDSLYPTSSRTAKPSALSFTPSTTPSQINPEQLRFSLLPSAAGPPSSSAESSFGPSTNASPSWSPSSSKNPSLFPSLTPSKSERLGMYPTVRQNSLLWISLLPSTSLWERDVPLPSLDPSPSPSSSVEPTLRLWPSELPSLSPSGVPSLGPTTVPSQGPSTIPTLSLSKEPTPTPSVVPTSAPSRGPTTGPSAAPTSAVSQEPSNMPSKSIKESLIPQPLPTTATAPVSNIFASNHKQDYQASSAPIGSSYPSNTQLSLTLEPSATMPPTSNPTEFSSNALLTASYEPSTLPSADPSIQPTASLMLEPRATMPPTSNPTESSSNALLTPSYEPSTLPSAEPSIQQTASLMLEPSATMPPTSNPTESSSNALSTPSYQPSTLRSADPSIQPTAAASAGPSWSANPTGLPSSISPVPYSRTPSIDPSAVPSLGPLYNPSALPSSSPSTSPVVEPSVEPSLMLSIKPYAPPTAFPASTPSFRPSTISSTVPSSKAIDSPSRPIADEFAAAPLQPTSPTPLFVVSKPPSVAPSLLPSLNPSDEPSSTPWASPSVHTSSMPSLSPSIIESDSSSVLATGSTNMHISAPSAKGFNSLWVHEESPAPLMPSETPSTGPSRTTSTDLSALDAQRSTAPSKYALGASAVDETTLLYARCTTFVQSTNRPAGYSEDGTSDDFEAIKKLCLNMFGKQLSQLFESPPKASQLPVPTNTTFNLTMNISSTLPPPSTNKTETNTLSEMEEQGAATWPDNSSSSSPRITRDDSTDRENNRTRGTHGVASVFFTQMADQGPNLPIALICLFVFVGILVLGCVMWAGVFWRTRQLTGLKKELDDIGSTLDIHEVLEDTSQSLQSGVSTPIMNLRLVPSFNRILSHSASECSIEDESAIVRLGPKRAIDEAKDCILKTARSVALVGPEGNQVQTVELSSDCHSNKNLFHPRLTAKQAISKRTAYESERNAVSMRQPLINELTEKLANRNSRKQKESSRKKVSNVSIKFCGSTGAGSMSASSAKAQERFIVDQYAGRKRDSSARHPPDTVQAVTDHRSKHRDLLLPTLYKTCATHRDRALVGDCAETNLYEAKGGYATGNHVDRTMQLSWRQNDSTHHVQGRQDPAVAPNLFVSARVDTVTAHNFHQGDQPGPSLKPANGADVNGNRFNAGAARQQLLWSQRGSQWIQHAASLESSIFELSEATDFDSDDDTYATGEKVKWICQEGTWIRVVDLS